MSTQAHISTKKTRWTLALGLLAAAIVACTSVFQFSLVQGSVQSDSYEAVLAQIETDVTPYESSQKADSNTDSQETICKIQAVSQGVQLHVTYTPIVWASLDVSAPELKLEIPTKLYKASWAYFRVLFTDIIAPNAP